MAKWDPGLVKRTITVVRPVAKRYFRSKVRGLDKMPPGGALVISNHSGGLFTMDVAAFRGRLL
jgi:1-acyl-sn-glycerol-3-phosphate acyltransferase